MLKIEPGQHRGLSAGLSTSNSTSGSRSSPATSAICRGQLARSVMVSIDDLVREFWEDECGIEDLTAFANVRDFRQLHGDNLLAAMGIHRSYDC